MGEKCEDCIEYEDYPYCTEGCFLDGKKYLDFKPRPEADRDG